MKIVRLIKAYQMYQAGETAGFNDGLADKLIASGSAVDPVAEAKAQKEATALARAVEYARQKAEADAKAKADADAKEEADAKAKAARTAMLFSRTNTMLSIPMLFAMVAAQNMTL